MGSTLTLQLNNVQILEKMLGGDSVLEVELRQSIVNEFSKKYLKGLVDKIEDKMQGYVNKEVSKLYEDKVGKMVWSQYGGDRFHLKDHIKQSIEGEIKDQLSTLVTECIKTHLEQIDLGALVSKRFDYALSERIKEEVKVQLNEKWQKIVTS
jgi:hypothetical protein